LEDEELLAGTDERRWTDGRTGPAHWRPRTGQHRTEQKPGPEIELAAPPVLRDGVIDDQ
jgi:hypothetical protein